MCVGLQGFLRRKAVWIAASLPYKYDRIVSFQVFEPSLEPKESPKEKQKNTTQKLMKMDQIGLCQTWHVPRYEGSLRSVLSHSALQLNEL